VVPPEGFASAMRYQMRVTVLFTREVYPEARARPLDVLEIAPDRRALLSLARRRDR
jgi:hypothetical protein